MIDLDNGAINREELACDFYEMPRELALAAVAVDAVLRKLTPEQFKLMCVGEEDDRVDFIGRGLKSGIRGSVLLTTDNLLRVFHHTDRITRGHYETAS